MVNNHLVNNHLVGGWAPPLWKMMEFVNWDDEFPNILKNKIHVPNHQPNWNVLRDSDQNLLSCRNQQNKFLEINHRDVD